jgi:hypothetical protein
MTRTMLSLIAAAAAALTLAAGSTTAAPAAARKLTGTVGPGFTITLKKGTTKVRRLPRHVHVRHPRQVRQSQFRPEGTGPQAVHERLLRRHEDGEAEAQAGEVHVRVRSTRFGDARFIPRRLDHRRAAASRRTGGRAAARPPPSN